jgi:hypothetical protein
MVTVVSFTEFRTLARRVSSAEVAVATGWIVKRSENAAWIRRSRAVWKKPVTQVHSAA